MSHKETTGYVLYYMLVTMNSDEEKSLISMIAVILNVGRIASGTAIPFSVWTLGAGASTKVGRTSFPRNDKS